MFTPGQFYMHDTSKDVCVLVLKDCGGFTCEVQWWNLGCTGNPWPIDLEPQRIYMHPDVWTNITDHISLPRTDNA